MKISNLKANIIKSALEARYGHDIQFYFETDWEAVDKHAPERLIFSIGVSGSSMKAADARAYGLAIVEAADIVSAINAQEWVEYYGKPEEFVDANEASAYHAALAKRVAADVPVEDVIALIPKMFSLM